MGDKSITSGALRVRVDDDDSVFFCFLFFLSSGGWVKIKLKLLHFPRIRYMSCFGLTHAPVATEARAAATGFVRM